MDKKIAKGTRVRNARVGIEGTVVATTQSEVPDGMREFLMAPLLLVRFGDEDGRPWHTQMFAEELEVVE